MNNTQLKEENKRLNLENEKFKTELSHMSARLCATELNLEAAEEYIQNIELDFTNPHGAANKILNMASGILIKDIVAFSNIIHDDVKKTLQNNIHKQKMELINNEETQYALSH